MRYIAIIPPVEKKPNSFGNWSRQEFSSEYYDLTEKEIRDLAKKGNIVLPPQSQIKLGFWTAWGGKIILLLIFALYMWFRFGSKDEEIMED